VLGLEEGHHSDHKWLQESLAETEAIAFRRRQLHDIKRAALHQKITLNQQLVSEQIQLGHELIRRRRLDSKS
jgi:hypothetical protein